jgi:hypothetical protein
VERRKLAKGGVQRIGDEEIRKQFFKSFSLRSLTMKIFLILALAVIILVTSSLVKAQVNEIPSRPTCGTLILQENPARQSDLPTGRMAAFQVPELLLYIRFDATIVRPGFDSASNFTSSIVSGVRSLPAPNLTQEQKNEIVRLVQDDFSPFNIRVTTNYDEFLDYPAGLREMVLVTTTPSVAGFPSGTGGVSPFNGNRIPNAFAFTFSSAFGNNPVDVAAVISHEAGHLLSLAHQNLFNVSCNFVLEYIGSFGQGRLAFHPLMGLAIGEGITNWFAQSCPANGLGFPQDDFVRLNSVVSLRPDDFPNVPQPGLPELNNRQITGVLEQPGDVDMMLINFRSPRSVIVTSDNIDLKVTVLTPGGHVMGELNDPLDRNVVIPEVTGAVYLKIEGESNVNMSSRFMTGTYHVSY